ncbi:glycosyltransferase, partial [bacterium]|nr:glycosyltransferase [bacterium]
LFPDRLKSWNRGVIRCLDRLVRSEPIGAVLINVAPFSGLLLSRAIKKRFSIPVVLNFRDAFSFNNYYQLHRRSRDMHRAMDVEREAFDSADRAVFVTPFMMSGYSRIFPEYAHKMCVIPNGYDEDDFLEFDPDSGPEPGTGPGENCFTIGYNGSFSKLVPMRPLAHALCTIYETHGIRIRLSIATKNTESEFRKLFPDLFRLGLVDYRGFLPHRESLANLGRAHLLTFMFADNPATEGAFSGKVFEYLRTYKPILLLHKKDSDIARLIADTTAGITVHIDSQDEIIRAILHFHELWQNGRLRHVPDKARIRQYDYRTLAKQMASVFDALQADEKGE